MNKKARFPMIRLYERCGGNASAAARHAGKLVCLPPVDQVNHPSHYTAYPVEVIDMIRKVLGPEGFKAYCLGNEIKYRMRAGLKGDNADQDIAKAMKYKEFREAAE